VNKPVEEEKEERGGENRCKEALMK